MKRIIILIIILSASLMLQSQNDTMYVMKNGLAVIKVPIKPGDFDSIVFYNPAYVHGRFVDERDGRVYRTVVIGEQTWMAENLKYLPKVSGPANGSWKEPYYYVYGYEGNDVSEAKALENFSVYGVLYNMPFNEGTEAIPAACPPGWHLPKMKEIEHLADYLGGTLKGGNKLRAIGTSHWEEPNTDATNETGFSALPSGYRVDHGDGFEFKYMHEIAVWWTGDYTNWGLWQNGHIGISLCIPNCGIPHLDVGLSIRCVKD
jgi:uncharacterized protein (TIGR02145 family)